MQDQLPLKVGHGADPVFLNIAGAVIAPPNALSAELQNRAGLTAGDLDRILRGIAAGGAILPLMKGIYIKAYAVPAALLPADKSTFQTISSVTGFKNRMGSIFKGETMGDDIFQWRDIPCLVVDRSSFEKMFHGAQKTYGFDLGPGMDRKAILSLELMHIGGLCVALRDPPLPGYIMARPYFRDNRILGYGVTEEIVRAIADKEGLHVARVQGSKLKSGDLSGRREAVLLYHRKDCTGFISADLFEAHAADLNATLAEAEYQAGAEERHRQQQQEALKKTVDAVSAALNILKKSYELGLFTLKGTDIAIAHGPRALQDMVLAGFEERRAGSMCAFQPAYSRERDLNSILGAAWGESSAALRTFTMDDGSVFGLLRGDDAMRRLTNSALRPVALNIA